MTTTIRELLKNHGAIVPAARTCQVCGALTLAASSRCTRHEGIAR